jgi:hypothetical protein
VQGLLDVMLGAGLGDVLGSVAALLGIGIVLLAFGVWRLESR